MLQLHRIRASSVQEQGEQRAKLPNILTPTFADWKIISDSRAHPKISRRNPLFKFGLIPPKKVATPSSSAHQNPQDFRGLKSEEQSQRLKENIVEDRISTTETNTVQQFELDKNICNCEIDLLADQNKRIKFYLNANSYLTIKKHLRKY